MNDITVPERGQIEHRQRGEFTTGAPAIGFIPQSMDEVDKLVDRIMFSGTVPSSYESKHVVPDTKDRETRARLTIGILKGLEVGMGPITALTTIAIINNRPCIWGDGAVALCQRSNQIEWEETVYEGTPGEDDWIALYSIKRRGREKPYVGSFSVGQAKRAHLWMNPSKKPWIEYPGRMLFNRARAYALRDGFSDCLMGLGIVEEVRDIDEAPKGPVNTGFLDDTPAIDHAPQPLQPYQPPTEYPNDLEEALATIRAQPQNQPATQAEIDPLAPYVLMDRKGLEMIFDDAVDIPKAYRAEVSALWEAGDGRKLGDFDRANSAVIKTLRPDVLDQIKAINREIRPKREPAQP